MRLSIIVAVSDNDVISQQGKIPWRLPADFSRLKKITTGHPIIMGRKTHDSIGRTLAGRTNIVISRNKDYQPHDGSILVHSLRQALNLAPVKKSHEAFIFGGQSIYEQALPKVQRLYLTRVRTIVDGDTFFRFNPSQWRLVHSESHKASDENPYDYEFMVFERQKA